MATGKMMSEYTPFSELTSEEKATYLGNASVTTFGAKVSEGDNINVNIPLSTLVPSAPVSDVTVNGSSVVSDGVAVVTVPTASGLAGDGLSVNGSTGKLDVSNKVPAPTTSTDRGKVLTVNNSDEVVWDTPASSTYVKEDKGLTASGSYIGVECAGTGGLITDANGLSIKHDANDKGKFLTVGADNEITWGTPSGGGGGGNPYTKVSVTPGSPYKNTEGRSAYGWDFSDQDVNISNNTYSILSTRIGEGNGTGVGETASIDHFNIKLPAGTDFPMAVVEFRVSTAYGAGVNKVKVFVGNTEIPELHEAPYSERVLVADNDTLGDLNFNELKDTENTSPAYKYLKGIHEENYKKSLPAYLDDNLVQVHIFGSGFKVVVSKPTGVPAES